MTEFESAPDHMKLAKSEGTPLTARKAREIMFALMQEKMDEAPEEMTIRASHISERKGYLNQHNLSAGTTYHDGTLISFTFLLESWEHNTELNQAAEHNDDERLAFEIAAREASLAQREANLLETENAIKAEREALNNLRNKNHK